MKAGTHHYLVPGIRWQWMYSIKIWLDGRPWNNGIRRETEKCWPFVEGRSDMLWDSGAASQACPVAASGPCVVLAPTPVGGAVLVAKSLTITPVAISKLHCDLTVLIICPVNQNPLQWSFFKSEKMENQSKRGISILVGFLFFQSPKLFFLVFLFNSCINICKKKKKRPANMVWVKDHLQRNLLFAEIFTGGQQPPCTCYPRCAFQIRWPVLALALNGI